MKCKHSNKAFWKRRQSCIVFFYSTARSREYHSWKTNPNLWGQNWKKNPLQHGLIMKHKSIDMIGVSWRLTGLASVVREQSQTRWIQSDAKLWKPCQPFWKGHCHSDKDIVCVHHMRCVQQYILIWRKCNTPIAFKNIIVFPIIIPANARSADLRYDRRVCILTADALLSASEQTRVTSIKTEKPAGKKCNIYRRHQHIKEPQRIVSVPMRAWNSQNVILVLLQFRIILYIVQYIKILSTKKKIKKFTVSKGSDYHLGHIILVVPSSSIA